VKSAGCGGGAGMRGALPRYLYTPSLTRSISLPTSRTHGVFREVVRKVEFLLLCQDPGLEHRQINRSRDSEEP
jgi:hypothetical protein